MKYFIDKENGEVFAYESDGFKDEWVREGLEPLDAKGLAKFLAAQAAAAAPTSAQILAAANAKRDALLTDAGLRIAPLQDAVDLESATDVDTENLKLWKQYRIAVNRVPEQPKYPKTITWPAPPSE